MQGKYGDTGFANAGALIPPGKDSFGLRLAVLSLFLPQNIGTLCASELPSRHLW
jgi:hypothetical protein